MLDDAGSFSGGAAKEIEEETGLVVKDEDLIDLTALAFQDEDNAEELQKGVYTTPGACDEFVPIFLHQKRISRKELDEFRGKLTGLRNEGEKITLKVVKLGDLWKEGARDGKTLSAWALYCGLKKEGKI
jgi:ADP-sugar diphosphatase